MQRYNLVYFPCDGLLNDALRELASDRFGKHASDYLLGHNAIAHVTLCQFTMAQGQIPDIWNWSIKHLTHHPKLTLDALCLQPGQGKHADSTWAWMTLTRDGNLIAEQKQVIDELAARGVQTHTESGLNFKPRITLALLRSGEEVTLPTALPQRLCHRAKDFDLGLGNADGYGALSEILFRVQCKL